MVVRGSDYVNVPVKTKSLFRCDMVEFIEVCGLMVHFFSVLFTVDSHNSKCLQRGYMEASLGNVLAV